MLVFGVILCSMHKKILCKYDFLHWTMHMIFGEDVLIMLESCT